LLKENDSVHGAVMIDSFHRNYNYNNILVKASAGRKKDEIYFTPVAARRTKD